MSFRYFCLLLFIGYVRSAEHCPRFSERSDGDVSYDPDDEIGLKLGSIATLQCSNGNIRRSRCTANGWKPSTFNRCQQVVRDEPHPLNPLIANGQFPYYGCQPIMNVTNGFVTYEPLGLPPYKADTTASLVCNLGFVSSGKTTAKCDPSGRWTEIGNCESATVQQCLPINQIENGQVSYINGPNGAFSLNSVAELSCKLGFSAVGNNRVICSQTGWEPSPGIGRCIEKENKRLKRQQLGIGGVGNCVPLSVINGQVTYLQSNPQSPYSSGTTALLSCNPNFIPIGSTSSYCSGSIWSPTIGTCSSQSLGASTGFALNGLGGVPTSVNNGLGLSGATCPALPVPLNGQIMYSMGGTLGPFPSGTTATLTCNPGFTVNSGAPTASCQNGIWNPSVIGSCGASSLNPGGLGNPLGTIGATCPAAVVPANGQLQYSTSGLVYPEGTSVTLICNANFQLSGSASSTCRSGSWYPPLGLCVGQGQGIMGGLGTSASMCSIGLTAPIGGGTVQYSTGSTIGPWNQGATATLICPIGTTSPTATAYCQNGQWVPSVFQPCSNGGTGGFGISGAGSCIVPLAVMGGNIAYSNGATLAPFPSGTVGTLQCQTGSPLGPTSASCTNGQWSPTNLGPCGPSTGSNFLGTSTGQQCNIGLLTPANGQLTYSQNGPYGPFQSGTSATLTCFPNYVVSGSATAHCQGGVWSPSTVGPCLPSSG